MPTISPLMIFMGILMGSISAYLAYKRERNPYIWFAIGFLFGLIGVFAAFFGSAKKKNIEPAPKAPVWKVVGPSDKFWYYVDPAGSKQGPMSRDALTAAWKEGRIDLSTYVWHEEMSDWKPLKETATTE